jgi:Fe-S-cluster-containing dehydrogenase component
MTEQGPSTGPDGARLSRRSLLRKGGLIGALATFFGATGALAQQAVTDEGAMADTWGDLFQQHYKKMSPQEMADAIARIKRKAKRTYGVDLNVGNDPPLEGVVFGYAINISKCKGTRRCVEACVRENNLSRDSQIQYIRVLEMEHGNLDLTQGNAYYDEENVPRPGRFYLPIQCMQCENPPCVKACPVEATWREPDGVVVIDFNWCIGCRYCMTACPYWARHFNWTPPTLPKEEINTDTQYLSNRPRMKGVMEKCMFCLQRTRKGRLPACLEACPTGARVFGNLLDPNSDIRYVLENKTVFRLKEDLGTEPKFWYYTD